MPTATITTTMQKCVPLSLADAAAELKNDNLPLFSVQK